MEYERLANLYRPVGVEVQTGASVSFVETTYVWQDEDIGHWLEGLYQMENSGDYKIPVFHNRVELCYGAVNQYKQAERYY